MIRMLKMCLYSKNVRDTERNIAAVSGIHVIPCTVYQIQIAQHIYKQFSFTCMIIDIIEFTFRMIFLISIEVRYQPIHYMMKLLS